jgi:hypothetical protein
MNNNKKIKISLLPLLLATIFTTAAIIHQPAMAQITGATPTPPTPNGVLILGHSEDGSDFGSLYIVGEVKNNLSSMVNYVQIVGTFYDAGGTIIDSDFTYTDLDYLRPGEKSPFRLIISDEAVASRIENYTLSVNWEPVNADPAAVAEATVLMIEEGEQREAEFGGYEVIGQITNGGTSSTEYVKVTATFYDENGRVIDTDYTYTDPSDLAAGQSAPFEIRTSDEEIAEDIESVKLATQSTDYFGVDPELAVASTPTTAPPTPQQQQQPPSPSTPELVL